MSIFDLIALFLSLTAAFSWLNRVYFRLPPSIGILVMGLASSLVLILLEISLPQVALAGQLTSLVKQLDFQQTVMNGLLAFLLFAGALHVDLGSLRSRMAVVGAMATMGVAISTAVIGFAMWVLAVMLGIDLPLIWALVLGAIVSPTDPVAVLATLKAVSVPRELETDMAGESLFNDGVGVVVFTALLAIAGSTAGGTRIGVGDVAELFIVEALGGGVIGLVCGYLAYLAMRAIDDYPVEVLISIALAMGSYSLALALHTSGPIAVVIAGILIGNRGPKYALSDETQQYLFGFWTLVDHILNSVLFLLIGLEVLVVRFEVSNLAMALLAIPVALTARFLATFIPVALLRAWFHFVRGTVAVLVWGGLRGGISIALALSLPETEWKSTLLAATYSIVIFTILVQGLSLERVARYVLQAPEPES